ncbi:MAG: ATPase [Bacteroidetes bacterium]|nr:MAG: ATPase [Bacteroidota bacterium]
MSKYLPEYIATSIESEKKWLSSLIQFRSIANAKKNKKEDDGDVEQPGDTFPPMLCESPYKEFIEKHNLTTDERAILILGIAPHICPELLDVFLSKNPNTGKNFTEFGGRLSANGRYFLPTAETAAHLLAGYDMQKRLAVTELFEPNHTFLSKNILHLEETLSGEPRLSGTIAVSEEVIDYLTTGLARIPTFSSHFPAKLYTTQLGWDDMVFGVGTRTMLDDVKTWLTHHRTLFDEMGYGKRLGKGYKALFHGPPGNGKSVTAALLGKHIGKDVLRIDLSMVVSKYIGETEKNLKKVFDRAERTNAILFFDEADALFGKRTATKDAHDKYANQEVNYLLQRIEEFYGIIFLATNFRNNLDDAFTRRFNTMVYFPMPDAADRLQMWKKAFTDKTSFGPDVKLNDLSDKYSISYAQIANIGAWCTLMAIEKNNFVIDHLTLRAGLARELGKEGRTL